MHDPVLISPRQPAVSSHIELPLSKSILNRYIIMAALQTGHVPDVVSDNDPDDVKIMGDVVENITCKGDGELLVLNCGNAGTVVRMAALLAVFKGRRFLLTGNSRMLERPVNELADTILQTGASLNFQGKRGFLPFVVDSKGYLNNRFKINALHGSQHLSGLLMTGPFCNNGIEVKMLQKPVSWPYVEMTLKMMSNAGAVTELNKDMIRVFHGGYTDLNPVRESDWSSAAFFLQAVALMPVGSSLLIEDLDFSDLQGDQYAAELFRCFGVEAFRQGNGVRVVNNGLVTPVAHADFIHCPDLFNSWTVTAALLNVEAYATGVDNLVYKESDRLKHLIDSLRKNGFNIEYREGRLKIIPVDVLPEQPFVFQSDGDHRVAMSFAMAGVKHAVILRNPCVVSKSFPGFFSQLDKVALLEKKLL